MQSKLWVEVVAAGELDSVLEIIGNPLTLPVEEEDDWAAVPSAVLLMLLRVLVEMDNRTVVDVLKERPVVEAEVGLTNEVLLTPLDALFVDEDRLMLGALELRALGV